MGIGLYCRGDEVKRNESSAVGDGEYRRGEKGLARSVDAWFESVFLTPRIY